MQASQIPSKIPLPFANSGTKNSIPVSSQIGITAGAASFTDGFPPLTMTPLASGGVPPSGQDFNGILNLITAVQQWQCAGGGFKYDSAFSTQIGGYPKGAIIISATNDINWLNIADNNTTNPDATDGSAANWISLDAYGIAAITGLTNANVTLTPVQYGKQVITLTGTLTGNIQIIFPTVQQQWTVINNTTGAFTVTCKTASGTGATVVQGGQEIFYGDGTNLAQRLGNTPAASDNSKKIATTEWIYSAMSTIATAAGFVLSVGTNGYLKLPSWLGGFIFQWGTDATNTTSAVNVTFPIAFPANCFGMYATPNKVGAAASMSAYNKSTTGFTLIKSDGTFGSYWIAVGN